MTITISRLYDDYSTAQRVVDDLEAAGLKSSDISIIASNADSWYRESNESDPDTRHDSDLDGMDDRVEGAVTGASIGVVAGGAAGLLAGLGIIAIPGIGPAVAAGWLASLAAGTAAGGAAGGIIGALSQAGVSHEDAHVYAEGVRRGGTLVTARVPESARSRYEAILDRSAVNIKERGDTYRASGWSRFDESARPYSAEQTRRERAAYQSASDRRI